MARVSVIIPSYNRANQVVAAVRSVLDQSCPPFEVIVIDDGSTDSTWDALLPFRERIRYIKTPNSGASAARNVGVREARGEWIAFLDSDDTWDTTKLWRQLGCVERTGAKVCFCVSTDQSGARIDDLSRMDGDLGDGSEKFYPAGDCRLFKYPRHPFLQSLLVERHALMSAGMFDETLAVAEDTKFIQCLVLLYGYSVVNACLVTICRSRPHAGLSDTMDSENAFSRYGCYVRVQAEAYWRLVAIDSEAANLVRKNLLYFVSRQAEIACSLGLRDVAKRYARSGLSPSCGWRDLVRNSIILAAYPLAERRFSAKWACGNIILGNRTGFDQSLLRKLL